MGNQDNWSTPKQIKIERAGDPKPLRRGHLKKSKRRKGPKARIDEIKSCKQTLERHAFWMIRDMESRKRHPEWYSNCSPWRNSGEWFDEWARRMERLLTAAIKDGIVTTNGDEFRVKKPEVQ